MARKLGSFFLALILIAGGWLVLSNLKPANLTALGISALDPTATDQILASRTIVDFGTSPDGTVTYSYLAEPVPALLAEREVPELRTENSFTKFEGVEGKGEDEKIKLTSTFYSQPAYAQDVNGEWKYLEYATTTEQAFRNRPTDLWQRIAEVFVRTAYADVLTKFSGVGDGQVQNDFVDGISGLGPCQGVTATGDNATLTVMETRTFNDTSAGTRDCTIIRAFIPFDTSSIPALAVVSAATLDVYVTANTNGDNDGSDTITVVNTQQADSTTLALSDFTLVTTGGSDSPLDITAITTSAYNTITLNATGIGWIEFSGGVSSCGVTTGVTCLGLREGHDISGSGLADDATNSITVSTSEDNTGVGGTDRDPFLTVTYSIVASVAVQSGMRVGPGGSLRVVGGGVKIF